ncbi:hypothetical protein [Phytopseudomonas daroniae]|uniref:hypothetical protein n=1 Tax=Phytopseudomonas daroniae TaxID=2487519 RepID=UPI0010384568|nr:hypothetical protein [Pseudomonas daroniae]TBU71639.1 hypothetical protein DNK10_23185 [Pseudomonas daroniae]
MQVLAEALLAHEDQGEYDDFFAKQIFEPLVKEALEICEANGIALKNPVKFVNSPGLDPSPTALPSSGEHLIFAGQGTSAFCNYWSKIFSSAIAEISELPTEERSSSEAVIQKLREGHILVDAARLALRYALFNSVLGFGRVEQPRELFGPRVMLVSAMEIFAIGHEIGHFLAHEAYPDASGISPEQDSKTHELECDAVGLAISTAYGVRNGNSFAFQLIGPLLLFYALRICEQVKSILIDEPPTPSESHPSHEERFKYALNFLYKAGATEDIKESVHFALDVAMHVGSQVQMIAKDLKAHMDAGD